MIQSRPAHNLWDSTKGIIRSCVYMLLLPALMAGCAAPKAQSVQPVTGLTAGTDGMPWWNDTVFYEIFVRSFADSDGDGIGDFNGITQKLDYLNDGDPNTNQDLGISGIWLMPIHPSPSYHGYDVTDYYAVNPDYGTMDDFKRLMEEAHKRGIRIIIDLVLNHTSSDHPWFQASRDPASPYRSWYVWSAENPGYGGPWGQNVWQRDTTGYYYHIFIAGMPDLNYTNPEVTKQMEDVVRFWLQDVGVDGFRLDAIKYLIEEGSKQEDTGATHELLESYRIVYKAYNPQAVTVGEITGQNSKLVAEYTQGDELDLAFSFSLAGAIVSGAKSGSGGSYKGMLAIDTMYYKPGQFATFITNHDQDRVASEMEGDWGKLRSAAAMLLTAPGVPFIYYGEEIGMLGKKPDEQIRTPMAWSADANGGFTSGTPWEALNPGFTEKRNVADQSENASSLLSTYRNLIAMRNQHAALRVGISVTLETGDPAVIAMLRKSKEETVLVLLNLGDVPMKSYNLTVKKGPLSGSYQPVSLLDSSRPAELIANQLGGIDGYRPVEELQPQSVYLFQLQPAK